MKAKVHRASNYDFYWTEELNSLEDLLNFVDKHGEIVFQRNDSYNSKPYPNRKVWEAEKKMGLHECPIEIIIYDDYLE